MIPPQHTTKMDTSHLVSLTIFSISPHDLRKASKTGEKNQMLGVRCLDRCRPHSRHLQGNMCLLRGVRRDKSQGLSSVSRNVILLHLYPPFYTWDGQSEGRRGRRSVRVGGLDCAVGVADKENAAPTSRCPWMRPWRSAILQGNSKTDLLLCGGWPILSAHRVCEVRMDASWDGKNVSRLVQVREMCSSGLSAGTPAVGD